MRSTKESITLSLMRSRGAMMIVGCMALIFGLSPLLVLCLEPVGLVELVMFGMILLGFCIPGGGLVLSCCLRLHLVPEGAAVSLFGRTLARYPVEGLTVIRWDVDWMNAPRLNKLCLSTLSVEELAVLRERKLRSSVFYRDGVDYMKRRSDWQEAFAIEQLKKMTWLGEFFPLRRSVLWLEDSPETAAILKLAYPGARWHDLRRGPEKTYLLSSEMPKKRADTPQSFRRCHEGMEEPAGAYLLLAVCLIPTLVLLLLSIALTELSETQTLIGSILALVWLFGSLIVMGVCFFGSEQVSLEEDGVRLRPMGRRGRLILAGELKYAWIIRMHVKGNPLSYLVISARSLEELAQMEEVRMCKTSRGREELSALRLLEHWPELAVWRFLLHRIRLWGYEDPLFLLVAYTDEREQWIRERYPHLQISNLQD